MKSLTNYSLESEQVKLDSDGKEHGFEYVNLGLPSGTMWATCNVGADKPEDDGLLFQFGRTDGYKYGDKNNKFSTSEENKNVTGSEYINKSTSGTEYNKEHKFKLNLEDDAAHVNMGGKWKMPTKDDLQELYDNTTRQIATINDKKGMLFTSKVNCKSIFISFAGCWYYYNGQFYYSDTDGFLRSSNVSSIDGTAFLLPVCSNGDCYIYYGAHADGFSIRGVFKK